MSPPPNSLQSNLNFIHASLLHPCSPSTTHRQPVVLPHLCLSLLQQVTPDVGHNQHLVIGTLTVDVICSKLPTSNGMLVKVIGQRDLVNKSEVLPVALRCHSAAS
jgi:hypothetical protein